MSAASAPRPPLVDRVARLLAGVACVWFGFASAWGVFGSVEGGHIRGGGAGTAALAENMVKWHSVYPLWNWYSSTPATPADAYVHHPYGIYWFSGLLIAIFGHHDFVVSLPAAIMSAATPPLLWSTVRTRSGEAAGAAAACGFSLVPIALGFASYHNLEVMTMFGWSLFFWGHTRHEVTRKRRHMLASLAGVAIACSADWIGYFAVAVVLAWALLRAFVLPKRIVPAVDFARYARWWALSASIAVFSLVMWIALFYHADRIDDWLGSGFLRGGRDDMPLALALESRKTWIDFSFTPLVIWIGKMAVPLLLLRLVVLRRDEETYAPAVLFGALVQYVGFKRGADMHIYWPHDFALYFALALAAVVATCDGVVRWIVARFAVVRRHARVAGSAAALAATFAFVVVMLPDAVRSLFIWRTTGGRYDDKGSPFQRSADAIWVIEKYVQPEARATPGVVVDAHPSMGWSWEHSWAAMALDRRASFPPESLGPWNGAHPFFLLRASATSPDELKAIAKGAHVRVYGDVWLVDEREPPAPLDAYRVEEKEPNPVEWILFGPELVRSGGDAPDPFLTWEWRAHLGQDAPMPDREPRSLDELRIAHNAAVARGDAAASETLRERIDAQIERTVAARFDDDSRIVGVRLVRGALPRIETWFEAGRGPKGDSIFVVHAAIDRAEPLSLVPASPIECERAWATPIPPKVWKRGWLYASPVVMYHRIGIETYGGAWRTRDGSPPPARVDDATFTRLAVVR